MLKKGDKFIHITLPTTKESMFDSKELIGKKFMVSFLRFARCTFCSLRVHRLRQCRELYNNNFTIVTIFDSSVDNLIRNSKVLDAPFVILADDQNRYYDLYDIQHSLLGMTKGMVFRVPTLLEGLKKGFIPFPIKGSLTTMPADFLVDENGIIQRAYYGKDEADHLPIHEIIEFTK